MPTINNPATYQRGLLYALIAAFLFSCKPILIKWLYAQGLDATEVLVLRMVTSLPIYLGVIVYAFPRQPATGLSRNLVKTIGVGLLGYYLASYLDLAGLQYVSAQLERLTLYAYPTFVLILGAVFMRQAINGAHVIALMLTYAGLACVFGQDLSQAVDNSHNIVAGTALVLLSALSFSVYLLLSQPLINTLGSLLFTGIATTAAGAASIVHFGITHEITIPQLSPEGWAGILALALGATVLPIFLISEAIKAIGPAKTSLTGTIGPMCTSLLAVLILGEPFTWMLAAGMALVTAGVLLLRKAK